MRVLVTGHRGYIGAVLVPRLLAAGHDVTGLDVDLYRGCDFGAPPRAVTSLDVDVRSVLPEHCEGFDAVIHLAALSNDPLGDMNPELTYDINHRASVRLARAAKEAGVARFLFSSSCSLYGAGGDAPLDETAAFNPVTPYGESKILTEQDVAKLADDDFSPVYLRNATVYGASPRLRADLVVNNLTGYALTTGEVLIKSDGSPWRPLVHVEDVCAAFEALLEAPRDVVHDQAFNVGRNSENYRIRDVADDRRGGRPRQQGHLRTGREPRHAQLPRRLLEDRARRAGLPAPLDRPPGGRGAARGVSKHGAHQGDVPRAAVLSHPDREGPPGGGRAGPRPQGRLCS